MRIIKRNAIRCKLCGDVIESKHIHDWVQCECGACFVDGGKEYARIGGDFDNVEILTEYEDVPGHFITRYDLFGNTYVFETPRNVNELIEYYENNAYYLIIEDENHNEIYRTRGIDRIIAAAKHTEGDNIEN